jgi:thioredoxin 1
MIIENPSNLDEYFKSDSVILVFSAPSCGPCHALKPVLEKITQKHEDVNVIIVNVSENPKLNVKFKVMSLPTTIFFKAGKEQKRLTGFRTQEKIEREFNL